MLPARVAVEKFQDAGRAWGTLRIEDLEIGRCVRWVGIRGGVLVVNRDGDGDDLRVRVRTPLMRTVPW